MLLTIYNSLILPHLNYGILAWGYDTTRIFKLQKNSLRAISSTKYIAHTDPLFKSLALLKVEHIHKVQQLNLFYILVQNHRTINNVPDLIRNKVSTHSFKGFFRLL